MKRILILTLLCGVAGFASMADTTKTQFKVTEAGGVESAYDLTDISHITFENDKMVIHHSDGDYEHDINAVEEMVFATVSGVEGIHDFDLGDDLSISINNGLLTAAQPGRTLSLRIFDLGGRAVDSLTADSGLTYSLSQLPAGSYIVVVNDKALKFIR